MPANKQRAAKSGSQNRYALITGCGLGGIGAALATEFLRQDFEVICTVLPTEQRDHLANTPGCHVFDADVTSEESVFQLKTAVEALTGGYLDVLCNNAGIVYQVPAVDYEMTAVENLLAVNTIGPIRIVAHFHGLLIRSRGVILNTGSVAAVFPSVYQAAYCASKATLHQYCNTLAVELAPFGVRVLVVVSGEIDTPILKRDTRCSLKNDSIYALLQDRYAQFVHRQDSRMAPNEYASGVVSYALSRNPSPFYWRGTWAPQITLLQRFFPVRLSRFVATRKWHLDEVRRSVKEKSARHVASKAEDTKQDQ